MRAYDWTPHKKYTKEESAERAKLKPYRRAFVAGYWGVRNRTLIDYAPITFDEWMLLIRMFDGMCAYCGITPEKLTMDHIIPISKGGRHVVSNIAPACRSCNCRKRTMDVKTFMDKLK